MVSYISLLHTVSQNLQVRCRVLVLGGWWRLGGGGVFNSSLNSGQFFLPQEYFLAPSIPENTDTFYLGSKLLI